MKLLAQVSLRYAVAVSLLLLDNTLTRAQTTDIWNGGTGSWSGTTWGSHSPPNSTQIADFDTGSGTVTISNSTQAGGILFDGSVGAYALTGGSLTLNQQSGGYAVELGSTGSSFSGSNTTETINTPLTLSAASTTFINNSTNATNVLNFGSSASLSGLQSTTTLVLDGANSGSNTVAGAISDGSASTFNLTKNGAGTWILSGANTYNGTTTLNGGLLSLGSSGALGNSGTITFAGGTLQASSANTTDYSSKILNSSVSISIDTNGQSVTFANAPGSSNTGGLTKLGSGTLTITQTNPLNLQSSSSFSGMITIPAGALQLGGAGTDSYISNAITDNSSLVLSGFLVSTSGVISGSGSVTLAGFQDGLNNAANTYTGPTIVNALRASAALLANGGQASSIGMSSNAASNLVFGSGTLSVSGTTDRLFTIGDSAGNAADLIGASGTQFTNTGSIAFGTSGTHTLTLGGNILFAPVIGDQGLGNSTSLITTGFVTLTGTNTYSGQTTVSSGTLVLSQESSLYNNNTSQWTAANISVSKGTGLNLSLGTSGGYTSSDVGILASLGNATGGFQNGSNLGLDTTSAVGGNFILNASISNANAVNIVKLGPNTLTFMGNNSYTGTTTLAGGTLSLGSSSALAGGGNIVFSGGTLQYSASNTNDYSSKIVNSASPISIDTNGQTVTFASILTNSNTGGLIKLGAGTLILTSTNYLNNYTGGTTISSGTLQYGNNSIGSVVPASGTITNDGTVVFDNEYVSAANVITGSGNLAVEGVGAPNLGTANTYTGVTTIDGSGVFINGTQTPVDGGDLVASVLANGGQASSIGESSNAASNLIIGGGGLAYYGSAAQSTDRLFTIGDGNGNTARLGALNNTSGVGALSFTNTGTIAFGTAAPHVLMLSGENVQANLLAATLNDQSSANPTSLVVTGYWDLTGNNAFTGGTTIYGEIEVGSSNALGTWGAIDFDGGILQYSSANTIDYSSRFAVSPGQRYYIDTNGQTVTFASPLNSSNAGGLYKIGTGTLIIAGNSTYVGDSEVNAGTLQVGNGGTFGSLGAGTIVDETVVAYDRSDIFTESNNYMGSGDIQQVGTGTLVLTGSNVYTGGTMIRSGTLQVGNGGVNGSLGSGGVTDSSALIYDHSDMYAETNTITGSGSVAQQGSGTLSFSQANTYTGATILDAGILKVATLANDGAASSLGSSTNAAGNLVFGGGTLLYSGSTAQSTDRLFTIGDANGNSATIDASGSGLGVLGFTNTGSIAFSSGVTHTLTLTGSNSGANTLSASLGDAGPGFATTLIKTGLGTWVLAGTNSYTGSTLLESGTLNLGSSGALGGAGPLIFSGGTLQYSAASTSDYSSDIVNSTGTIAIDTDGQNVVFASGISASNVGGLNKLGSGTLTLEAVNAYSGGTTVSAGALNFNSSAGPAIAGNLSVSGGTANLLQSNQINSSASATVSSGTFNIQGSNLTLANVHLLGGAISGTTGTLTSTNAYDFESGTASASLAGSAGLIKTGSAIVTLSGANSYTGVTNIEGGELNVSNSDVLGGSTLTFSGGSLQYGAGNTTDYSSRIFNSTSAVSIDTNGQNVTFASVLDTSNSGGFTKVGSGILTFAQGFSMAGTLSLNGGELNLGGASVLNGVNAITFGNGWLQYSAANATDYSTEIVNSSGAIIIDTNGQNVTFATPLASSNTGGFFKEGAGTLTFTAQNVFVGTTTVVAGELNLDAAGGPAVAGNLSVNGGTAYFSLSNEISSTKNLIVSGGTVNLNGTSQAVSIAELNGGSIIGPDGTVSASSLFQMLTGSDTAALTGAANLTKTGPGTVTLSGTNTYSGTTAISGGVLEFGQQVSLYDHNTGSWTAANITVGSGATLALSVGNTGGFTSSDVSTLLSLGTASNGFTNGSVLALDTGNAANGNFTYGSAINNTNSGTNTLSLTKLGANPLTLSGTNNYTGKTTVAAGTLQFTLADSLYDAVTTRWTASNIIVTSGSMLAINVGGTGQFTTANVSTLAAVGSATGGFESGSALGLDTTNATGGNFTYSGAIANPNSGANVLSLAKLGTNTLTLTGSSSFTGTLEINAGTVAVSSISTGLTLQPLGRGNTMSLGVSGVSTGTFLYTGNSSTTLDKNVAALGNGIIQNTGLGMLTLTGTLTKTGTVLTLMGGTGGINLDGLITGGTRSTYNSDLNVAGGLVLLSTSNNYFGPTAVYGGGTLRLNGGGLPNSGSVLTLGSIPDGAVTNTFDLDGYNNGRVAALNSTSNPGKTNTNVVTSSTFGLGASILTITGTNSDGASTSGSFGGIIRDGVGAPVAVTLNGGSQTLTGSNSYSGGTNINGGLLLANNSLGSAAGSGNANVNNGGTLGGSGTIAPSSGNSITVATGGNITPGTAAIGSVAQNHLTISGSGTLPVLAFQSPSGATLANPQLTFDLGSGTAASDSSGITFAGSSSYIKLSTDYAGEVQFNNNLIQFNDLTNGSLATNGDYLLFQGGSDGDYAGLTLGSNGQILSGLELTGSTGAYYGSSELFLQNGDIYVDVVPEPSSLRLLIGGVLLLLVSPFRRRFLRKR